MPTTVMPTMPLPSINCLNLIKEFKGCKLKAYIDPGSGNLPITIGYGSTLYENGSQVVPSALALASASVYLFPASAAVKQ